MTEDQIEKAKIVLAKHPPQWSKADDAYIYGLIKAGHREALRKLRTQVLLNDG